MPPPAWRRDRANRRHLADVERYLGTVYLLITNALFTRRCSGKVVRRLGGAKVELPSGQRVTLEKRNQYARCIGRFVRADMIGVDEGADIA